MRPPALGYRLRAGIRAYGTSNVTTVKLLNQDSKLNARHSESQRDRWQDEYAHSLRIRAGRPPARLLSIVADHVYTRARQTTFCVLDHAWNGAPTRGSAVVHTFVVKYVCCARDHQRTHHA